MLLSTMGFGQPLDAKPVMLMPGALTFAWGGTIKLFTVSAAGLVGATSATAQVVASDGACFELALANVKKAETDLFQATGP